MKEESEKTGLKLNIQETKIMASHPIISWQIDGKAMKQWQTLFSWAPKSLQMVTAAAAAKSLQSCPTLCDPIDGSPPGSAIPGILQARTLEWVAISFSNAWKWKVKVKSFSHVWLFATPWTTAYQAPPSMGFSRQENWNGVSLPSPGNSLGADKYNSCGPLNLSIL